MAAASNRQPDWVHPLFKNEEKGIREVLPFWLAEKQKFWDVCCRALVPGPPQWLYLSCREDETPTAKFKMVKKLLDQVFPETVRNNLQQRASAWISKQRWPNWNAETLGAWIKEEDAALSSLRTQLPDSIRFRFVAPEEIKEFGPLDPTKIIWPTGFPLGLPPSPQELRKKLPVLVIELLTPGDKSENAAGQRLDNIYPVKAEPLQNLDGLRFWVADIPSIEGSRMVILAAREDVELGASGRLLLWTHGSQVEVTMPTPAAELDRSWDELPRILSGAKYDGRLFQAHRGGKQVRGDFD